MSNFALSRCEKLLQFMEQPVITESDLKTLKEMNVSETEWGRCLILGNYTLSRMEFFLDNGILPLSEQDGVSITRQIANLHDEPMEDRICFLERYYVSGADINEQSGILYETIIYSLVRIICFQRKYGAGDMPERFQLLIWLLVRGADPCLENKHGDNAIRLAERNLQHSPSDPLLIHLLALLQQYE
jgi:hypothetical protein